MITREMAVGWTELAVGLIMISSPWLLGFSDISLAKWCNVLIGLVLALMGAWMVFEKLPSAAEPAYEEAVREKGNKK